LAVKFQAEIQISVYMKLDKMSVLSFTAAWISRRSWRQSWDC